jgi:SAM-dependent methyltransferase
VDVTGSAHDASRPDGYQDLQSLDALMPDPGYPNGLDHEQGEAGIAHRAQEPLADADAALIELGRRLQRLGYRFTTVTPQTHEFHFRRRPVGLAQDRRDVFGWCRPFRKDLLAATELALMGRAGVLRCRQDGRWQSTVRWSSLKDFLLVHSAYPTDAADSVFFGPDTYRFAQAIDAHLQQHPGPVRRAVDIGCGSGAGAMVLAAARPDAEVLAVDINPLALRFARVNTELAGMNHIQLQRSDVLQATDGFFDLIFANPPYMFDPQARAYRHGGDAMGAALSLRIVDDALPRLAPGGRLLLYTGAAMIASQDPFLDALKPRLEAHPGTWTYREVDPDVFGEELLRPGYEAVERIAAVVLSVCSR